MSVKTIPASSICIGTPKTTEMESEQYSNSLCFRTTFGTNFKEVLDSLRLGFFDISVTRKQLEELQSSIALELRCAKGDE
jgi:hypothetical protein